MRFRAKLTLCMLALLSVLFGVGGSLLIAASFRDSLGREKDAALVSYRMAWGALQIVGSMDPYLSPEEMAPTLRQLYEQNSPGWEALRLAAGDRVLYESESARRCLTGRMARPAPGECLMEVVSAGEGERRLILSGAVTASGSTLYLYTVHNVSALYAQREGLQQAYLRVFAALALLCAVLSYTMAGVLTSPLTALQRASRAIASGDFSSRVSLRSEDEVGAVAGDFNAMAAQMEATVSMLHQAVERQERFVGSFAHEMKTPMTSLIGYAELLRSGTLTEEEQAEAAGYVYSEGRRLENLSRKLLELLVLRRRGLPLTPVEPGALVQELTEHLGPIYAARGVRLSCFCEPGQCCLEPDLVWSLLLNLTDNACKAMEQGGEIQIWQSMLKNGCRICVEDNGRGIPPEALGHLTEAFYRVDKARSREQGGFGLGLALCQEIVELHRGSLRIENRPGGGACVVVKLRGGRP